MAQPVRNSKMAQPDVLQRCSGRGLIAVNVENKNARGCSDEVVGATRHHDTSHADYQAIPARRRTTTFSFIVFLTATPFLVITYCPISLLSLYSRVPSNRSAGPCRAGTTISTIEFHLCVLIPFSSQSWSDSCQSQSSLYNRAILQVRLTLEYCEVNPLTDADFQIHRLLFPPQLSTTLNHTPPPSPIRHVLRRGLTVSPPISRVRPFEPSERLRLPKCLRRFSR